ncbi:uncharacterized protein LOC141900312 [Tubulanus polymorphus]|uniref:uncharacterized protein LOC141900312 n=1 Tax=Tubulanus polymorphus TaxID=672921 RepID=UPI003DA669F6
MNLHPSIPWVADGWRANGGPFMSFSNTRKNPRSRRSPGPTLRTARSKDDSGIVRQTSPSPHSQRHVKSATITVKDIEQSVTPLTTPVTTPVHKNGIISRSSIISSKRSHPNAFPKRRIHSAGTIRGDISNKSNNNNDDKNVRRLFSALSRSRVENSKHFQPDPDYRFLDRHAHCLGHDHLHAHLLCRRPRAIGDGCAARSCGTEHTSTFLHTASPALHERIGIRRRRPRTAPSSRQDYAGLPYGKLVRGRVVHFCNFVRPVELHSHTSSPKPPSSRCSEQDDDLGVDLDEIVISDEQLSQMSLSDDVESQAEAEESGHVEEIIEVIVKKPAPKQPVPGLKIGKKSKPPLEPMKVWQDEVKPSPPKEKPVIPVVAPPAEPWVQPSIPTPKQELVKQPLPHPVQAEKPAIRPCLRLENKRPTSPKRVIISLPKRQSSLLNMNKCEPEPVKVEPPLQSTDNNMGTKTEKPSKNNEDHSEIKIIPKVDKSTFDIKKLTSQGAVTGRLALSKQSCRFELPMDMRKLETMSPQEYLREYCVISSRRNTLYSKIFMKNKDGKIGVLTPKDLEKALKDVLINSITAEQMNYMFDLIQIDEDSKIDQKLFSGIAALAERLLYQKFVTEDTVDLPDHQKERIESADFCALNWKFHGVNVNPFVEKILRAL